MLYVPGAKHRAADAVSHHPSGDAETTVLIDNIAYISRYTSDSDVLFLPTFIYSSYDTHTCYPVRADTDKAALYSSAMNANTNLQCVTWDKVRTATSGEVEMHHLVEMIESGIPDKRTSLPPSIRDYFPLRDQLSTVIDQSVTSVISRAETSVFWPDITSDIINVRNKCNHCNRMAPSQPSAPPTPTVPPIPIPMCMCRFF